MGIIFKAGRWKCEGEIKKKIKKNESKIFILIKNKNTNKEAINAIMMTKNTASGKSQITAQVLKDNAKILAPYIASLGNYAVKHVIAPDNLLEVILIVIQKRDAKNDINGKRPIALAETIKKAITMMFSIRLRELILNNDIIGKYQNCKPKGNIEHNTLTQELLQD